MRQAFTNTCPNCGYVDARKSESVIRGATSHVSWFCERCGHEWQSKGSGADGASAPTPTPGSRESDA